MEENIIEQLKKSAGRILLYAEGFDSNVRALNQQNEQWFIDWQDKLNALSVK